MASAECMPSYVHVKSCRSGRAHSQMCNSHMCSYYPAYGRISDSNKLQCSNAPVLSVQGGEGRATGVVRRPRQWAAGARELVH